MDSGLQGNIEKFTLPEIFQLIASGRKSGTLGIQKDDSIVMVYFREGEIIYGYGPRQTFHLGQLLREKKIITDEQLEQAVTIQAKTENSKRLGEILISRGFIDRADLDVVVRRQVEELLYSLLSWRSGSFKFYEDQFPTQEEITVRLSVENVILEGLRRVDEINMVNETLSDMDDVYVIGATEGERNRNVAFQAQEWNIMALVDGHRTLNDICRISPIDRHHTLKKLAQLKLAGLITKSERREAPRSGDLDKMVGRLANLFEDYLMEKSRVRTVESRVDSTLLESDS
ncbi:MAG: DUF4388 domain-containing protein [Candidatus Zixiibacteriota bacterium]|nr:MAG: DUF4388 domain-containing protein [candidate division Zixibacteria bacterium]